MALPQSSYFEKVRLLEAWHGMALAWPWHAHFEKVRLLEAWHGLFKPCLASPLPCVALACRAHGLDMPCRGFALPFRPSASACIALPFTPSSSACIA
ncbi:unnamed protein product, partial [Prunus brigantina]